MPPLQERVEEVDWVWLFAKELSRIIRDRFLWIAFQIKDLRLHLQSQKKHLGADSFDVHQLLEGLLVGVYQLDGALHLGADRDAVAAFPEVDVIVEHQRDASSQRLIHGRTILGVVEDLLNEIFELRCFIHDRDWTRVPPAAGPARPFV